MKYRSIFISDIHLGIKYSRVPELLNFLRDNECDNLYLIGDIIDGWELKRKWYWDDNYNLLVQKILRKSRKGTNVVYITGNHDDFLRSFDIPIKLGDINITNEIIHTTYTGEKYLIVHGDKFDGVFNNMTWISHLGSWLYDVILYFSAKLAKIRQKLGMKYWSLSHFIKFRVKKAIKCMTNFEVSLVEEAKKQNVDGVICGHIHHASHKTIDGIEYYNCGSWLEHCNAVVEHLDGRFEVLNVA